jgi:hypothetical protein
MNKKLRGFQIRLNAFLGMGMILFLFSNSSFAQRITGKVIAENDEAIPGVNVIIEGTNVGTTTDANGAFELNVNSPNAVLVFSFIGYRTERIPVENRTTMDVTLVPDIQTLSEVVVVGYGTQKKVSMTAAVSTVSADEVVSRQSPNTISLLQGRTPGLQIVQNSGQPGAENNDI